MKAFFVQIKCDLGKAYEVASELADAEIASEIYSTAGQYDLLAKFYLDDEEDIGHFFPNTDPQWKGAPSSVFLEEAARQVLRRNGRIVNIDATVIAQAPKIYPHIADMKKRIAEALAVREAQIGIKATTNELMGFIGREEGIAAMAVAGIHLPE